MCLLTVEGIRCLLRTHCHKNLHCTILVHLIHCFLDLCFSLFHLTLRQFLGDALGLRCSFLPKAAVVDHVIGSRRKAKFSFVLSCEYRGLSHIGEILRL